MKQRVSPLRHSGRFRAWLWGTSRAAVMVSASLLAACATLEPGSHAVPPLAGHTIPAVEETAFLAVTPAMQDFLDRYVLTEPRRERRRFNLLWATTDPYILGFRYDPVLTLPPDQAFEQRTGNCLSFSAMFVAMARRAGLKARFQEVQVPPQWKATNNTLLFSKHINVVLGTGEDTWVVDISGTRTAVAQKLRPISDAEALAQYYNNQGAAALTENDLGRAYAWIRQAIATDARLPYLWTNLGVVFSRNEQAREAEQAYRTALDFDPGDAVASNNLYLLYERHGNSAAAEKLRARVEKHRRKNPYYLYHLAALAQGEGRFTESAELLLEAIRLNEREYRFHYELARMQLLAGETESAAASLHRAVLLAPPEAGLEEAQIDSLPPLPE